MSEKTALSFKTIESAVKGDAIAINTIIDHYSAYIEQLATIRLFDANGHSYYCVDEDLKRQLQTKLITSILKFKIA